VHRREIRGRKAGTSEVRRKSLSLRQPQDSAHSETELTDEMIQICAAGTLDSDLGVFYRFGELLLQRISMTIYHTGCMSCNDIAKALTIFWPNYSVAG
jgi:hypothetical protein